jgi:hypothetical protein
MAMRRSRRRDESRTRSRPGVRSWGRTILRGLRNLRTFAMNQRHGHAQWPRVVAPSR